VQAEGKNKVTPVYSDENDLIYLSNEKGVSNLFKYNRASATSSQLTNYIQNIRNADVTIKSGGALAYTYLNDGYYTAAFKNGFDINATVNTPSLNASSGNGTGEVKAQAAKTDSATKAAQAVETTKLALKDGEVDTDNYEFDEDVLKAFESRRTRGSFPTTPSALSRSKTTRENIAVKGPYRIKDCL
jgi:hypothetical protein